MYCPADFAFNDVEKLHSFIRTYNFATLVTPSEDGLQASHVPFVLQAEVGPKGRLLGHMAKENPHWRALTGAAPAIVIFQGPYAYVSPTWYTDPANEPAWNYVVVHATGRPRRIEDPAEARKCFEALIDHQEGMNEDPWGLDKLPADFVERMLADVVTFEIPIERLRGERKLSQDKSTEERWTLVEALETTGDPMDQSVAGWMRAALARAATGEA